MKKLLKAVALATVMCLLLSTAAFANYGEATGDKATKLIDANVINAGANEQVVLLIVAKDVAVADATEADIMYIDQKQANASGVATFTGIAIKDTETVVDIYVGSAATNGPQLIGNDIDIADVKVITLATELGGDAIITTHSESANGKMPGFGAAITVNIPEGLTVDKMIWGFKLSNENFRRYSTAQKVDPHTAGAVQFAAAFDIGYLEEQTVESVSAIFLTTDGNEHFTDEADKPNKKN